MKTQQQGFIGIIIAIVIALAVLGGGYAVVRHSMSVKSAADVNANANTQGGTVTSGGTTMTSNGASASVNAGGVTASTDGNTATVQYNGGSITNTAAGGSVQTNTSANASAGGSISGSASASVSLSSISPSSASIGQTVVIKGSGFSASGNTINAVYGFQGQIGGVASINGGTEIDLTIPSHVQTGPVSVQIEPGTYVVSVTNASGATSNKVTFSIK